MMPTRRSRVKRARSALRIREKSAAAIPVVFQVLPHTLGLGPEVWRVLSKCHDVRNVGEYEGDLDVDERIVADLVSACRAVAARLGELQSPQSGA